jgi:hypothetical protein
MKRKLKLMQMQQRKLRQLHVLLLKSVHAPKRLQRPLPNSAQRMQLLLQY